MADGGHMTRETPKAAQAWADYLALGPDRSLAKLHTTYVADSNGGKPAANLRQLEYWSTQHGWQDRLKAIADAQAAEATELRRATYLTILREYHRRYGNDDTVQAARTPDLHGVYDRVRPEDPKPVHIAGHDGGPLVVQFEVVPSRIGEGE